MTDKMTQARAAKGGEVGQNGYWYDGGQFLPQTKFAKMSKRGQKELATYTSKKQEVAPFDWQCPPDISKRSLWDLVKVAITISPDGKTCSMISFERIAKLAAGMGWGTGAIEELTEQAQRWLNGERWISQDEAPFFWWNEVKKLSN